MPFWILLSFIFHLAVLALAPEPGPGGAPDPQRLIVDRVSLSAPAHRGETEALPTPSKPPPGFSRSRTSSKPQKPASTEVDAKPAVLPAPTPEGNPQIVSASPQGVLPPATGAEKTPAAASTGIPAGIEAFSAPSTTGKLAPGAATATAIPLYDSNAPPDYPHIARRFGWQGDVLLRVRVKNTGIVAAVRIEKSSGYEVLDQSARDAVRRWRFKPALVGLLPVESQALVPIRFQM
ncbi:MAG: energy transducer TonB [Desulfuromonadales bacterium]